MDLIPILSDRYGTTRQCPYGSRQGRGCYLDHFPVYQKDFDKDGFEWGDFHDADNSIVSYLRRAETSEEIILMVCNFLFLAISIISCSEKK